MAYSYVSFVKVRFKRVVVLTSPKCHKRGQAKLKVQRQQMVITVGNSVRSIFRLRKLCQVVWLYCYFYNLFLGAQNMQFIKIICWWYVFCGI